MLPQSLWSGIPRGFQFQGSWPKLFVYLSLFPCPAHLTSNLTSPFYYYFGEIVISKCPHCAIWPKLVSLPASCSYIHGHLSLCAKEVSSVTKERGVLSKYWHRCHEFVRFILISPREVNK